MAPVPQPKPVDRFVTMVNGYIAERNKTAGEKRVEGGGGIEIEIESPSKEKNETSRKNAILLLPDTVKELGEYNKTVKEMMLATRKVLPDYELSGDNSQWPSAKTVENKKAIEALRAVPMTDKESEALEKNIKAMQDASEIMEAAQKNLTEELERVAAKKFDLDNEDKAAEARSAIIVVKQAVAEDAALQAFKIVEAAEKKDAPKKENPGNEKEAGGETVQLSDAMKALATKSIGQKGGGTSVSYAAVTDTGKVTGRG